MGVHNSLIIPYMASFLPFFFFLVTHHSAVNISVQIPRPWYFGLYCAVDFILKRELCSKERTY